MGGGTWGKCYLPYPGPWRGGDPDPHYSVPFTVVPDRARPHAHTLLILHRLKDNPRYCSAVHLSEHVPFYALWPGHCEGTRHAGC